MDLAFKAILAAFLGIIIAATITITIWLIIFRSRRVRNSQPQTPNITYSQPQTPNITSVVVNESVSFHPSLQISMSDIISATNNFSADLVFGDSRFGFVYKAELSNGLKLAIKKLYPDALQAFMEFRWELEILGKLRHRNVVRLLGYCVSGSDRILIFDFFENGSLALHLHNLKFWSFNQNDMSISRSLLSWEARLKIVRGVANGLAYMHGLDKPVIHRDVKSSNILLDSEFEAHISDFGLARMIDYRQTHWSTQPAGTTGYMAPEYEADSVRASTESDVYSFGILMLEVATGRRPNLSVDLNREPMSFPEWVRVMVTQNREMEMLDQNIRAWEKGLGETTIKEYFRIALMCAEVSLMKRPRMRDVVGLLARNFT